MMFVSLVGKTGEELLHEVAARYVVGMTDMDGRAPGPSSISGERVIVLPNNDLEELSKSGFGLVRCLPA